jgi:hypothetical protein
MILSSSTKKEKTVIETKVIDSKASDSNVALYQSRLVNRDRFNKVLDEVKNVTGAMIFKDDIGDVLNSTSNLLRTGDNLNTRGFSWNIVALDTWVRNKGYLINAASWQADQILSRGIDLNLGQKSKMVDEMSKLQNYLRQKLYKSLYMQFYLGYFHGGSANLIIIKGQTNPTDLRTPLRFKELKKGDFLGLKPLTRLYNIQPFYGKVDGYSTYIDELGEDIGIYDSTELGKPQFYRVSLNADLYGTDLKKIGKGNLPSHYIVHRSRLLIYNSSPLSYIEEKVEQFFGTSIGEKALLSMQRYENLINQISKLMDRVNVPVYKASDLAKSSMQGSKFQEQVAERIDGVELAVAYGEMILINEDEDFTFANAQFQHIPELLKEYKKQLIADIEAPSSRVLGVYEADDEHAFDYVIEQKCERYLRTWYEQLLPIIYKSEFNKRLGDYSFTFKPLEKQTQEEKAKTLKLAVEIISIAWRDGVIDEQSYHRMLIASTDNISDMLNELNQKYMEFVEKNGESENFETYNTKQIKLAEALNKNEPDQKDISREKGKDEGGNNKRTKKEETKIAISDKKSNKK